MWLTRVFDVFFAHLTPLSNHRALNQTQRRKARTSTAVNAGQSAVSPQKNQMFSICGSSPAMDPCVCLNISSRTPKTCTWRNSPPHFRTHEFKEVSCYPGLLFATRVAALMLLSMVEILSHHIPCRKLLALSQRRSAPSSAL